LTGFFRGGERLEEDFKAYDARLARFLTPGNFPRVVRSGGHLVIMQQEPNPEKRVGIPVFAGPHWACAVA
jgi:hypothetical protein